MINDYYVPLRWALKDQYVNEHFVSIINDYYVTLQRTLIIHSVNVHFASLIHGNNVTLQMAHNRKLLMIVIVHL